MTARLHIHSPPVTDARTFRRKCSVCQRRTTFFGWFQDWYGWNVTCLNCGDSWQDGELMPRPFKPRWRRESVRQARRMRARCRGQGALS